MSIDVMRMGSVAEKFAYKMLTYVKICGKNALKKLHRVTSAPVKFVKTRVNQQR